MITQFETLIKANSDTRDTRSLALMRFLDYLNKPIAPHTFYVKITSLNNRV